MTYRCGKEIRALEYTMEECAKALELCTKLDKDVYTLLDKIAKLADDYLKDK